jgi:hypothetical protein
MIYRYTFTYVISYLSEVELKKFHYKIFKVLLLKINFTLELQTEFSKKCSVIYSSKQDTKKFNKKKIVH